MLKHIAVETYAELVCDNCGYVVGAGGGTIEEAVATLLGDIEAGGWVEFNDKPLCKDCAGF